MSNSSKEVQTSITIHNSEDFSSMRKAGALAARVLDHIEQFIKPGVSTLELNDICHKMIVENGATPAPLNYKGYPKSICTSVNHVVCHGIPNEKPLKRGDMLNIDVTVIVDGWHGDTSRMYKVEEHENKGRRIVINNLITTTYDCMMFGIDVVKPGAKISDIGKAIELHAKKKGFSVVQDYCGHGIGKIFHTDPYVLHYVPKGFANSENDIVLQEGMFFTIEPMINEGKYNTIVSAHDGWTVTTCDKTLSAQYEHTIGVTNSGFEIFTV